MVDLHQSEDGLISATTVVELSQLLHAQHTELSTTLSRLPRLHDGAREDVFLQMRRHLAVHTALEVVVLAPRMPHVPEHFRLDREIVSAEQVVLESRTFDGAHARLAEAFLRHVQLQEAQELTGPLTSRERSAVEVAVQLWAGEGDAYLGNTWADMVTTACELVADQD